jgi:hypothetical protein
MADRPETGSASPAMIWQRATSAAKAVRFHGSFRRDWKSRPSRSCRTLLRFKTRYSKTSLLFLFPDFFPHGDDARFYFGGKVFVGRFRGLGFRRRHDGLAEDYL